MQDLPLGYIYMKEVEVKLLSEVFVLDASKAMYWPSQQALLIADFHIGKINHFRKNGIPVPINAIEDNFNNLKLQIEKYSPERVYFLGDLFHSDYNLEWNLLQEVLDSYPEITFVLIMGNHDILPINIYQGSRLEIIPQSYVNEPIILTHHPMQTVPQGHYNLCGHIHPGIRLQGKGKQSIKLPCFYFNISQGILPAFGTFTGTSLIESKEDSMIYCIVENTLIRIE